MAAVLASVWERCNASATAAYEVLPLAPFGHLEDSDDGGAETDHAGMYGSERPPSMCASEGPPDAHVSEAPAEVAPSRHERLRKTRVIEPVREPQRVRTYRSIASLLLGEDSSVEHALFDIFVRRQYGLCVAWPMWWLGLAFGLLAQVGLVPPLCCWCSLMMLPLPCSAFLFLVTDLVVEVAHEFETYFNLYLVVYVTVQAVHLTGDLRAVFWLCCTPSELVAAFADAYPQRYRSQFSKSFFVGFILILVVWIHGLYFGWVDGIDPSSTQSHAVVSGCMNLLFLSIRHCYVAFVRPDEFVVIISSVRTVHQNDVYITGQQVMVTL